MKWRSRKLIALLTGVALAFIIAGPAKAYFDDYTAPPYTYEGPIDPGEIAKTWDRTGAVMAQQGFVIGLKDPNSDAVAMFIIIPEQNLPYDVLGYLIYKDGRMSHFWLDTDLLARTKELHFVVNNDPFKDPDMFRIVKKFFFEVTGVELPDIKSN